MKDTNILCVCEKVYVRSVATRNRLNRRGYKNVIAIGERTTTPPTLKMLDDWAEVILLAEEEQARKFDKDKINDGFEIGEDIFGRYNHPMLLKIVEQQLDDVGLE